MKIILADSAKASFTVACFVLVCGCASSPEMYQWGSYQRQLYDRFTVNSDPEQQIEAMEKTLKANKQNKPMPPGFHAHLGLLYGETGRIDQMREQLAMEKELFPESAGFMDFLLFKELPSEELSQEPVAAGAES